MIKLCLIIGIKALSLSCLIALMVLLKGVYNDGDDIIITDCKGARLGIIKKLLSGFHNVYYRGLENE